MNSTFKKLVKKTIKKMGYDVTRFGPKQSTEARLMTMMKSNNINLVLDVGANDGHFASILIDNGYKGELISFEPLAEAFETLNSRTQKYKSWSCEKIALGSSDHTATINVAGNSVSSSMLKMTEAHETAAPGSRYSRQENIEVKRLDSIWDNNKWNNKKIWLKVDTQGYEMEVLKGAAGSLSKINAIQVEMSLVELYENSPPFAELLRYIMDAGFEIASFEPGFTDAVSGRVLQVDGIFIRARCGQ